MSETNEPVLTGKTALITVAARRSGRATALELAGLGAPPSPSTFDAPVRKPKA
jgi:hypothetical protein